MEKSGRSWGNWTHGVRLPDDAEPKEPIKVDVLARVLGLVASLVGGALLKALLRVCPRIDTELVQLECIEPFAISFACFLRSSKAASLSLEYVELEELDA